MLCQQRARESCCANWDKRLSTARPVDQSPWQKTFHRTSEWKWTSISFYQSLTVKGWFSLLLLFIIYGTDGVNIIHTRQKNTHNIYTYIYFFHQMLDCEKCFTNPYTARSFNVFCVVWELFKCILTSGSRTKRKRSVAAVWLADSPMTGTPLQSYIFQSFLNTFFFLLARNLLTHAMPSPDNNS